MTDKIKNMLVRTVTGVLFVAALVTSFLRFEAMVFLFAIITGLTLWEYATIVNTIKAVRINRFISTAAGVYFFLAVAGYCSGITPSAVFIPYLLTVVYLFVSELYTRHEHAINDWAYTMLSQMYIALPFAMLNVLAFQSSDDGIRERPDRLEAQETNLDPLRTRRAHRLVCRTRRTAVADDGVFRVLHEVLFRVDDLLAHAIDFLVETVD